MTGYVWRDSARVSPDLRAAFRARDVAELRGAARDAIAAGPYLAARESGLRVWEAAIAAGVSQSVGRRLERLCRPEWEVPA